MRRFSLNEPVAVLIHWAQHQAAASAHASDVALCQASAASDQRHWQLVSSLPRRIWTHWGEAAPPSLESLAALGLTAGTQLMIEGKKEGA